MNREELNHQLCAWIEQIRNCVPSEYLELLEEAAQHEKCRDELRASAQLIVSESDEWTISTESAKQHPSYSSEYHRLMNQARVNAPIGYREQMGEALEHERRFKELSREAKQHLPRGGTYRRFVSKIVASIQANDVVYGQRYLSVKVGSDISEEIYNAALSKTWLWFCENICRYDSSKGSVANWLNNRLQNAVKEELRLSRKAILGTDLSKINAEGQETDFLDTKADEQQNPSAYAELSTLIDLVLQWLRKEEGKLKREGLREYPQVNCYTVISHRLPVLNQETQGYNPPPSFAELAEELEVPVDKLRQFFNKKCRPKLQQFCE